jgi:voltage-gated potassium channel
MRKIIARLNSGYYNYLLIFLVLLFAFRPYNQGMYYVATWKFFFTCTIFTAIFNCKHQRRVKIAAIILAIPALIFAWMELFFVEEVFFILNFLVTIGFLAITTSSILSTVLLHARVKLETLKGVVCVYFLIGFLFAYVYYLIEFFIPGSFHLIQRDVSFETFSRNFSQMMYFSFITLLTIGFGDISPLLDLSQTAVVIEGIIGQFYIAILVARIVAVYAFYTDKKLLKDTLLYFQRQKPKR